MVQASGGLGLAEEALLDLRQHVALELLREGKGLDRDHAIDLRILALVDDPHRTLPELRLHLVAAQHGFLGPVEHHGGAGAATALHGVRIDRFDAPRPFFHVAVIAAPAAQVVVDGRSLVELTLALVIETEVVDEIRNGIIERDRTELVEGHVELALPLQGKGKHAVAFRACALRDRERLVRGHVVAQIDQRGTDEGDEQIGAHGDNDAESDVDENGQRHEHRHGNEGDQYPGRRLPHQRGCEDCEQEQQAHPRFPERRQGPQGRALEQRMDRVRDDLDAVHAADRRIEDVIRGFGSVADEDDLALDVQAQIRDLVGTQFIKAQNVHGRKAVVVGNVARARRQLGIVDVEIEALVERNGQITYDETTLTELGLHALPQG